MLSARQQHCLQGMGIRLWRERGTEPSLELPEPAQTQAQPAEKATPADLQALLKQPQSAPPTEKAGASTPEPTPRKIQDFPLETWDQLQSAIEACHNCALGSQCTRKVPGKGNRNADLMIIGEAPGAQEDRQGLPFVGRAGQLLDRMLKAIDLDMEQVYITNILKCRPPSNRDPLPEEVAACKPLLDAQIQLIKPRVILSVGRISAQNLLGVSTALGKLRMQEHCLPGSGIPLLVTYHPAYLLRNPAEKYKSWHDLKKLKKVIDVTSHLETCREASN